jgi:RNA polymerase sigma-70 factor (ECF subfamily)
VNIEPILKRIAGGDRQAFAELVAHYQRPLFGFLGRMGLSQPHGEEIAQEAFLRAWKNLGDYDPKIAGFSTWLFTIARNLALKELSRASSQQEQLAGEDLPDIACERPQPPDELANAQQRRRLQAALQKLPLPDRSALALVYVQALELAAVARIEGCTVAAIKTRLHRARQKLCDLLEKMKKDLDELLGSGLLTVPEDFPGRIMRQVEELPVPGRRPLVRERLQWLALLGGAIVGIAQLVAFMFGIWAAVAVG